ncbi:MAG TPA: hypothetical protein P5158_08915 [Chitinophagaceae bacterium]|nr:hypothetical protein [Chitinophagales bacterium]HRX94223.1 hypothetical protein [Chitinophagaceae bacterium]
MKKLFAVLGLFAFMATIILSSCKKEGSGTPDNSDEAIAHSNDEMRVSNEIDAVSGEVNLVLSSQAGFAGRGEEVETVICDATIIVDTTANPRTVTVTFNGTSCLGDRTRTGVIVVSMDANMRWKNPGATVTVSFQNYKVTRISDNKSITINGTKTITNQSGGLLINLPTLNSIVHLVNSDGLTITFDDGTERSWQVARKQTYTYENGVVLSVEGNHSDGTVSGIAEWGTNRFGGPFTTVITEPLVIRQDCSLRLTGGKVTHEVPLFTVNAWFGLNETGAPTSCPGTAAYYMKLTWSGPAGNIHTTIIPYY